MNGKFWIVYLAYYIILFMLFGEALVETIILTAYLLHLLIMVYSFPSIIFVI